MSILSFATITVFVKFESCNITATAFNYSFSCLIESCDFIVTCNITIESTRNNTVVVTLLPCFNTTSLSRCSRCILSLRSYLLPSVKQMGVRNSIIDKVEERWLG